MGDERYAPCHAVDLGNLARLEDGVGNAAEGGADVKGEHQAAALTAVGFSCAHCGLHGA